MADGKWIDGLKPDMNLEVAASKTLEQRLEMVAHHLPLAMKEADKDDEYVHQLRVATRRGDASLRIYKDCLPGKVYRQARARLRTIRHAAGEARDCDVFLTALRMRATEVKSEELAGLDFLIAHTLGQREAAQRLLESVEVGYRDSYSDAIADTFASIRPPHTGKKHLGAMARVTLTDRLHHLAEATRENLDDYNHLHQVRIAGKRLRYAIEVLVSCFGPALKDTIYPQIEQMQEILGRANDSHMAISRLHRLRRQLGVWPGTCGRVKPGIEALLRFHQRRLPVERKRFLSWLAEWKKLDCSRILGLVEARATA